jgi:hypothetical protein
MKRAFAVILVLVFLSTLCGYLVVFRTLQHQVKREQRQLLLSGIPASQVEIMAVPVADIHHGRNFECVKDWEICYKETMFDFFREVKTSDTVYFYGITDHKENQLLAKLKKDIKHHKSPLAPESRASGFLKQLQHQTYLLSESETKNRMLWSELNPPVFTETPVFRPHLPETPPPKGSFNIQPVFSA